MTTANLIALSLGIFVVVVIYLYSGKARTLFIEKPILGLLDLSNGVSATDLVADRDTLKSVFHSVLESVSKPPKCDVLFVYCQIESNGTISGSEFGLRELIREAGASIVVVASENTADACVAASKKKAYGSANLVMTLDRRGELFGRFFYALFNAMKQGTSMPVAWVKLAPQIPGRDHPDVPSSIFLCEAGQIAFR